MMPADPGPSDTDKTVKRLDVLIALHLQLRDALTKKEDQRDLGTEAVFLRSFGLRNPEIAAILGSTPGSVAELISRAQRPKKGIQIEKPRADRKTKNK
jgi:hypothetical protein